MNNQHILLNKDRYFEFTMYAFHPHQKAQKRLLRFLFGPKVKHKDNHFWGPKAELPRVKQALILKGINPVITEDWI